MAKFKPGETSKSVLDRKERITKSIFLKSKALDKISSYADIPKSLKLKSNSISEIAVHVWSDTRIGLYPYSRNSAHTPHNKEALRTLLTSITNANLRLSASESKNNTTTHTESSTALDVEIRNLRRENESLKDSLAEVYRAYMQLVAQHREDEQIDKSYRDLVLEQAKTLGKNRLKVLT